MIHVKFKTRRAGGHLHVRIYASDSGPFGYAFAGEIAMHEPEYQGFVDALAAGAFRGAIAFEKVEDLEPRTRDAPLPCEDHPEIDRKVTVPLLDDDGLAELRIQQADDARSKRHCAHCTAQVWHNYCREHDEMFEDGHYKSCSERTAHQGCERTY